jgi:hypothetical protein
MFNLNPKKPPAPKPLWRLQLLTGEYLIEGCFNPDENKVGSADIFEMTCENVLDGGGIEAFHRLGLTNVEIQPTGVLSLPEQSYAEWGMTDFDQVIAVIPRDEASLQAAQKAFQEYRYPLRAEIYAGPYRLRGKILSDSTIPRRSPFLMNQIVPLVEAEIDNRLPGARLSGLRADWMLLNGGGLMHGYGIVGA